MQLICAHSTEARDKNSAAAPDSAGPPATLDAPSLRPRPEPGVPRQVPPALSTAPNGAGQLPPFSIPPHDALPDPQLPCLTQHGQPGTRSKVQLCGVHTALGAQAQTLPSPKMGLGGPAPTPRRPGFMRSPRLSSPPRLPPGGAGLPSTVSLVPGPKCCSYRYTVGRG